jgi:hypothetical protein
MDVQNSNNIISEIIKKSDNKLTDSDYFTISKNIKKMSGILNKLIEYDINGIITSGKPFLNKLCDELNNTYNVNFSKKEVYNLLFMIAESKKIKPRKESIKIIKDMKGGFYISDKTHYWIGILGLIPALGTLPDAINIILYLLQGKYIDALLAFLSLLPIIGLPVGIYNWFIRDRSNNEDKYEDNEDNEDNDE